MDQLIEYISKYVKLSDNDVELIRTNGIIRTYLKHQFIVQNGDVCKYENFIISGSAKTFFIDQDGNEHVVMLAIENWWTTDLGSFITQQAADYNVQCLEKTTVVQFSFEALERLYNEVPQLERFFRIIIQKAFVAAQRRIVRNNSMPALDRYLQFRAQYPEIEQRVPQYLIASYLGISKQFLSRIRARLANGI